MKVLTASLGFKNLQDIVGREDVQAYIDGDEELSAVREKYGAGYEDLIADIDAMR